MTVNPLRETKPAVAVFGAAGHTGRFVVLELLCRGIAPIAIARNLATLSAANFGDGDVSRREASVDDLDSLNRALAGAHAVINCAGPFLETADAVTAAALR
ncbi:MAG: NAD(P)H-binding protein, partial [Verrucomicrobia bacterium]|nr:NAD(P)H-binding protein [Verrucomicrobiota bacterium]